jgi:putative phage-type endonuclease
MGSPPSPYRVVLPASADRAAWLETRRTGIGSSDIPAIMGVSAFGTAQHVYYDKHGELPLETDAGEAALWGTLHEETVAREWARRNRTVVRRVGVIASRQVPWQMCTLDRLCTECPAARDRKEVCAVEVKTTNAFVASKWKRKVPDHVLAQVLWQIHVAGFTHLHVACLIGGSDYRQYTVTRKGNEQLIADIATVAGRLWGDVQAGRVPPLTGEEPVDPMLDLYGQLHPDRAGVARLDEYDAKALRARELLLEYEAQRLTAKRAEDAKDAAKLALVEMLGDAEVAIMHGEPVFTFAESAGKANCDLSRLAERWPDAYTDCVSSKPSRRFLLAPAQRLKEIPE